MMTTAVSCIESKLTVSAAGATVAEGEFVAMNRISRSLVRGLLAVSACSLAAVVQVAAQQPTPVYPTPTPTPLVRPRTTTPAPIAQTPATVQRPGTAAVTTVRPATPAATPIPRAPVPPGTPAISSPSGGLPATSLPSSPAYGSVATPPAPVLPIFAAPQPVKPLAPGKASERVEEAKRSLRTRTQLTALGSRPSTAYVTIAALDPDKNDIHHVTISKQMFLRRGGETRLATSLGKLVRLYIARPNYVNTAVVISDEAGKQLIPLVVEYPIEKFGSLREMAYYTSSHPALMSPELVKDGQAYVRTMLDLAAKRLKDKGRNITPEVVDIAERLCLVEHVDHQRFRTENRRAIYDDVFALYALNGLDTYRYSVSSAGAGGMVQMIPPTYQMVRRQHAGVGLNPDFVFGMRNHGNALEAMLLYMQDTWNDLAANSEVQYALSAKYATQKELMSAGYNSNPAKLPGYLYRGGTAWRTLIPRETQMYLQIYSSIESLVPMKERGKTD